jgi:glycosyltransferase involved in cell wall biosynthesis
MTSIFKIAPVSVVIPCFRCGLTIERALRSVLQQSQVPAEVILVDDASGDDTWAILTALEEKHPGLVKLVQMDKNQGAGSARNAGWATASQPFIAFLDADDAWHPEKIEIQYAYMKANPDVALCGHGHRVLKQNVLPSWKIPVGSVQLIHKWALMRSNRFVTPSAMLRSNMSQRFVEKQRHMEDHMLWLKIVCSGARVVKLSEELAAIYKEPFGVTGLSAQVWLMERADLGNYRRLYADSCITSYQLMALGVYSALKYVRRLFIYWGYLLWRK